MLRQNGYTTLQAASYEQALSLAASHDLQLLLTDSVMPYMSDPALAERITENNIGLPVVYMSGAGELPSPDPAARPGAGRIQKPFDRNTLLEAVHAALSAHPGRH
jgi:DNA-binding NtrC family response regulator